MLSSPPSEDPLASFDFLSEFLPAIDFGEGFRFDEPFNCDDSGDGISMIANGGSPSYGAYDDDSCSFSVESSVQLRGHRRHQKRRSPYHLYCRKELSYWSGFVLGGSLCHSGREVGSGRAGFVQPR